MGGGGGGGTGHFFLLTLYNSKNIGGARVPPGSPSSVVPETDFGLGAILYEEKVFKLAFSVNLKQ